MICDNCGKLGARVRRTTRSFGSGRSQFLIEGVHVVCCPLCGERYLTAATLKQIEQIKKNWRKLTAEKRVPVAKFKGVA